MQIQFWAATDTGLTRNHNEDNFLVDRKLNLFIVADGMGGHAAGEIASSVAVHEVRKVLMEQREVIDSYAFSGSVLRRQPVLSLIERAISQACQLVYRLAQEDSERHGMGTTLSMLLIINGRGFVGHVGDSRIYMTRGSEAKLVTEDHSVINELIKSGRLNPEEAHNSPYKNAVTRAVGVHEAVEVDTFDFEIRPGDNYLLCSDGLSGYFEKDEEIKPYLSDEDLKAIPQRLIDYANSCGGKDNITAIVIRMTGEQTKSSLFNPPSAVTSSTGGFGADSGVGKQTIPPDLDLDNIEGVHDSITDELEGLQALKPRPASPVELPTHDLSQLPLDMMRLTPLFSLFDLGGLEEIAHHAEVLRVGPDHVLALEGEADEALLVLLSGEARLERGSARVGILSPGDSFGEERLLSRVRNEVSVTTTTHSVLLSWGRATLYHMMTVTPAFGARLMWGIGQVMLSRVERFKERLGSVKVAIEQELSAQPELTALQELISLEDATACAIPAQVSRELIPSFILDLDTPALPMFKTPLSEAIEPQTIEAIEAEQALFTSDQLMKGEGVEQ